MKKTKYSKEILENVIKKSISFSDVVRKLLNVEKAHGSMVSYIKKLAVDYKIEFEHFNAKNWNKNKSGTFKGITEQELRENYLSKTPKKKTNSHNIKTWLFKLGLKEKNCEVCNLTDTWNGKPLSLQLDHIDGDNTNNELSNLRIICPNCHSQTETFCGKNNGR
jgi:hypothetical protein